MNNQEYQRYGIMKLNAHNYHTWKHKTQLILTRERLWHTVIDPPPNDRNITWLEKDEMARATIGLLVEDRYLVDVRDQTDAHSTWEYLARIYGQNNMQNRMALNKTLFTIKFKQGSDMSDHLVEMMEISAKLRDLGHPLDEPLMCSAILCSLPPEYTTLITTIEANSDISLSTDIVRSKIMEEFNRHKKEKQEHQPSAQAMTMSHQPNTHYNSNRSSCFYCHKVGHLKKDCRLRRRHEAHNGLEDANKSYSDTPNYGQTIEHGKIVGTRPISHLTLNGQPLDPGEPMPRVMTVSRASQQTTNRGWVIDTGACEHLCNDPGILINYQTNVPNISFTTADGSSDLSVGIGEHHMPLITEEGETITIKLFPVYCLPSLTDNLVAIRTLDKEGYTSFFKAGKAYLQKDNRTFLVGESVDRLYRTYFSIVEQANLCKHKWHDTLGHVNQHDLTRTLEHSDKRDIKIQPCHPDSRCDTCLKTKLADKPYKPRKHPNSKRPFEMIHSDICGPITPQSLGGNNFILTIVDDFTKYGTVHAIRHQSDASHYIKSYIERNNTRFGKTPSNYRTDGGGEFCSKELEEYFFERGIKHQKTVPYTPQENGLAERFNRTLLDTIRSIIKHNHLPKNLWGEVAHSANYLNNLVIRTKDTKTPFENWFGRKPEYGHLRTIGIKCVYLNTSPHKRKLDDRGLEGILVGFGESKHIYRIWDPKARKIVHSRRVAFQDKKCLHCPDTTKYQDSELIPISPKDDTDTPTTENTAEIPPRRSLRPNQGVAPRALTYDQKGEQQSKVADWFQNHELTRHSN